MVKLIGAIFVITASSLIGCQMAQTVKKEYRELLYIQQMMYSLQSEIRYKKSYLGEAFLHVGRRVKEPYQSWMIHMSAQMEEREAGIFSDIWEMGIQTYLLENGISKEERLRLSELGEQFITSDIEMQMTTLELYQEQLSLVMKEKREGMRTKMRLCHCLGVMGGVFLTILFI